MSYNISLKKDKSIGKVVFIVEGDKKEHSLLEHVFRHILDYSLVDVRRKGSPISKYVSAQNPNSRVFVISSESSNIKSAGLEGRKYLDSVYNSLYKDYALDISNAAVYYIFDRDNESNMYTTTEQLTQILRNSRDNDTESNGLLLLSYPCIEAYIKSCVDGYTAEKIDSPKSLKCITGASKYQYSNIDENSIIIACNNMLLGIEDICGYGLSNNDLDDFAYVGGALLDKENQLYLDSKQYWLLSLLSVAFIDLGLLSIESWNHL